MGNDTGGWIARELALLEPEKVTHLALMNTEIPGHRPPWIPLYQRLVRLPGSSFVFRRMLTSRAVRRSAMGFGGCFQDLALIDGEFAELFIAPLLASPDRLASVFRFLMEMNFERSIALRRCTASCPCRSGSCGALPIQPSPRHGRAQWPLSSPTSSTSGRFRGANSSCRRNSPTRWLRCSSSS